MKGDKKMLDKLNGLLADELTAINQYIVHSEMNGDWGYEKLHKMIEKRAIDEMKHAERLIGRILFMGGTPVVNNLKKINIGAKVDKQFDNDHAAEEGAIGAYNDAIELARKIGDNGTANFLQSILKDEEDHIDLIEAQQGQIEQIGLPNYLVEQVG